MIAGGRCRSRLPPITSTGEPRPARPARAAAGSNAPSAPKAAAALLVRLLLVGRVVRLGGGVPAAVEERGRGRPVLLRSPAGRYPLEGGGRVREPRLASAKVDDLAPHRGVGFQADRPPARRDQDEPAAPGAGCAQRVLHGDVGPGRVPEHVRAVQAEMILQGRARRPPAGRNGSSTGRPGPPSRRCPAGQAGSSRRCPDRPPRSPRHADARIGPPGRQISGAPSPRTW